MNEKPKVAIVIPTYNRVNYLKETLLSALSQTYDNIHVYVLDDCSSDGTQDYMKNQVHSKLTYIRNKQNIGPALNFKKCIDILDCNIELVNILCDDDKLESSFIEILVNDLIKNSSIKIALGKVVFMDDKGKILHDGKMSKKHIVSSEEFLSARINYEIDSYTSSALFNREAMLKIGNYPQISTGIGGDDFFIYCIGKPYGIIFSSNAINYIRRHPKSCCIDSSYRIKHAYALKEFYDLMLTKINRDNAKKLEILDKFVLARIKSLLKKEKYNVIRGVLKHYEGSELSIKSTIGLRHRILWTIERFLIVAHK